MKMETYGRDVKVKHKFIEYVRKFHNGKIIQPKYKRIKIESFSAESMKSYYERLRLDYYLDSLQNLYYALDIYGKQLL